ncbi:MAG: hypothetical protein C5B51_05200 [Terriglobia bacterium]|nr:MAG: hypothetical protein C5B51_05200 [Terriglobia bacterium]
MRAARRTSYYPLSGLNSSTIEVTGKQWWIWRLRRRCGNWYRHVTRNTRNWQEIRPATVEERQYVDTLIRADWQLRRLTRADARIWEYEMDSAFNLNDTAPLGHAFERGDKSFWRIQRRIEAAERSYQRALRELERLQANRPQPLAPSQPAENASAGPQIGFVPSATPPGPSDPPPIIVGRTPLVCADPPGPAAGFRKFTLNL